MTNRDYDKPLEFDLAIGKQKPNTVRRHEKYCPFCDVPHLKGILDKKGPMIWLKNAFPVLKNTDPTLIIETDNDDGEFIRYTPEYAESLLHFAVSKWMIMRQNKQFKSVLFYRNYGRLSGGTIHHPHMQVIGLKEYDYHCDVRIEHLKGQVVLATPDLEVNLSDHPLIGFNEFNLILHHDRGFSDFSRYLQLTAGYITERYAQFTDSYNLYFYYFPEKPGIFAKAVPRFLTNPLYVGYRIPQITDENSRLETVRALKNKLLSIKD